MHRLPIKEIALHLPSLLKCKQMVYNETASKPSGKWNFCVSGTLKLVVLPNWNTDTILSLFLWGRHSETLIQKH